MPDTVDEQTVQEEIRKTMENPRYFRVCTECEAGKPRSWMHDERTCQACAERKHGVVYLPGRRLS